MSGAKPSTDDALGMAWFNSLTECQRLLWLLRAGSDVSADAWAIFKASQSQHTSFPNAAPTAP
ncbi:MAG TPA: hypothetical protein VIY90_12160 [Steroidobacteraceae bacterium]